VDRLLKYLLKDVLKHVGEYLLQRVPKDPRSLKFEADRRMETERREGVGFASACRPDRSRLRGTAATDILMCQGRDLNLDNTRLDNNY
jgi:hypothetical protein